MILHILSLAHILIILDWKLRTFWIENLRLPLTVLNTPRSDLDISTYLSGELKIMVLKNTVLRTINVVLQLLHHPWASLVLLVLFLTQYVGYALPAALVLRVWTHFGADICLIIGNPMLSLRSFGTSLLWLRHRVGRLKVCQSFQIQTSVQSEISSNSLILGLRDMILILLELEEACIIRLLLTWISEFSASLRSEGTRSYSSLLLFLILILLNGNLSNYGLLTLRCRYLVEDVLVLSTVCLIYLNR